MKKIYQLLKNINIYNQKKEGCEFFFFSYGYFKTMCHRWHIKKGLKLVLRVP